MIKGVTEVLISATKLPPDLAKRLWVQVFEAAEGGWGLGGQVYVPRGKLPADLAKQGPDPTAARSGDVGWIAQPTGMSLPTSHHRQREKHI